MNATLALIKPEICAYPQVCWAILSRIRQSFKIAAVRRLTLKTDDVEKLYHMNIGKFYYNRLKWHMCSGPLIAMVLVGNEGAHLDWRKLMGTSTTYREKYENFGSLRSLYGLTDHRNAVHGSDSREAAQREIQLLFHGTDINCLEKGHSLAESDIFPLCFPRGSTFIAGEQPN